MLTYKAMYKFVEGGVHGEVLDFPSAITCGKDIDEARELLAGALVDMAETNLMMGETLPVPDPARTDPEADLEEPIHLILNASSRFTVLPVREGGKSFDLGESKIEETYFNTAAL